MNLIEKLFGRKPGESPPDVASMSIDDVWEEFCRTVRPPRGDLLIRTLQRQENAAALRWLQPPADCPMAKGTMRALVDLQRNRTWKALDNLALVYRGDTESNLQPPQESLHALANLCVILQIPGTVYYKSGIAEDAGFAKTEITFE
ncbi:MAG: hypothetical protein ACTHK7_09815 [Aureliella sp.]